MNCPFVSLLDLTPEFEVMRKRDIDNVVCPQYHQFSLVFANVGGVAGVWPWTKVKNYN